MKKAGFLKLLLVCAIVAAFCCAGLSAQAAGGVAINETNFPDETFRAYVSSNFDTNKNNSLSESELAAVTKIEITTTSVASLQGIEYFTALTELTVGDTWGEMEYLTALDLSANTGLKVLYLTSCYCTSLDLSKNMLLEKVYISYCSLESLDLSYHTALKTLYCKGSYGITKIDLTGCTELSSLGAYWLTHEGNFTQLDIGSCPKLVDAYENSVAKETNESWVHASEEEYFPKYLRFKNESGTLEVDYGVEVLTTAPLDGWEMLDGAWYYYVDCAPVTGWQKIGGTWYWFDDAGIMVTGWKQIGDIWYYFESSGAMKTGWASSGSTWYWFADSGGMATDWQKIDGTWYYFSGSGRMQIGWQKIGETWYYFSSSGAMQIGWQKIGGAWYYFFSPSGAMAANEWVGGYWLNANGSWTYPYPGSWKQNSTGWWFGDESGWYAKNQTVRINGTAYTFNAAGYLVE